MYFLWLPSMFGDDQPVLATKELARTSTLLPWPFERLPGLCPALGPLQAETDMLPPSRL